jgi:predicted RNase H-like HicB family nuclease
MMMNSNLKYEITIYWSETDEIFIAEVPELAGCMADGETYDEALNNAQIVINQWIETAKELNRHIPKPKNRFAYA